MAPGLAMVSDDLVEDYPISTEAAERIKDAKLREWEFTVARTLVGIGVKRDDAFVIADIVSGMRTAGHPLELTELKRALHDRGVPDADRVARIFAVATGAAA